MFVETVCMPRFLFLYTCGPGSDWNTWFQLFGWMSEYFWQYGVCADTYVIFVCVHAWTFTLHLRYSDERHVMDGQKWQRDHTVWKKKKHDRVGVTFAMWEADVGGWTWETSVCLGRNWQLSVDSTTVNTGIQLPAGTTSVGTHNMWQSGLYRG